MAPKLSQPPKEPQLSQSSRNHRVQKRPSAISRPRPQISGRDQAIRGNGRSKPPSNGHSTADNWDGASWTSRVTDSDDADEHTATQVDISMLGSALDESIRDSHAELQNRVRSGENSPQLDQVSQHLLASPPSSPDSVPGGCSPKTPTAKLRHAELQQQELEELMKRDDELHRMMNDLSGIREWWKGNKQAWHEMREKVRSFDNDISALQAQVDQHRRMVWNGKDGMSDFYGSTADFLDERWAPQIEELKEQREANLPWFDENKRLMRMVWARVKEMGDTVYIEAKDNRKLASSYLATYDISNLSWFHDRGLKWWLRHARRDMEILRDKIQGLLDSDHAKAEQRGQKGHDLKQELKVVQDAIKDADSEADFQISELQENKSRGYEADIKQILEDRRDRKVHDSREAIDLEAMIKDLQLRDQESVLMRKTLTDIYEQNRQIRRRLNETYTHPPKINPADAQSENAFYTDVYHLVQHHIHRTIQGLDLGTMLDKVSYSQTKRENIIIRMEIDANDGNTEPFFVDFAARMGPRNAQIDYESLRSLVEKSSQETQNFRTMVEACQNIIDEPNPAFTPIANPTHPASYMVPNVLNVTLEKAPPDSPFEMARTMGSNITLALAKSILEKPPSEPAGTYTDNNYPWYELLRNFFTSPDIFPLFRSATYTGSRRLWNKNEFIKYVNSLLKTPLEHRIIEAFLVYCSHTSDLFRITEFRRRVNVISNGWELCEENRVRGLYRKVPPSSLSRPRGIDRLEHVLCKNWGAVGCENPDRNMDEEDLRKFLNGAMPNDHRISKERMRKCVSYWSNVGQFFVLVNPIDEYADAFTSAKLLRIDSGFNLPTSLPLLPISAPPPNFDQILTSFQTTSLAPLRKGHGREGIDERMVYRFLFLGVERGGMNWEVSRFQFHCFLRWCSQNGKIVEMARDGGLRLIAGSGSAGGSRGGDGGEGGSGNWGGAGGGGRSASGSRGGGVSASGIRGFSASGSREGVMSANSSGSRGQSTEVGQGGQSGSGHGGSVRDPSRRYGDGEGDEHGHGYARQGWNGRDDDVMSYHGTTLGDFIGK